MKRRTTLVALALVASGLMASTALAQDAPVNLTWQMWSGSDEETAVWQHLADMVHEKHPNITVTLKTAPWGDYWTKLPILAASGQVGDIVAMQSLRTPSFYQVLEPLNAYVERDGFDKSAFVGSIMEGMSANGQLYGLPYDVGPWVVFYNKDKFEAAGLALPAVDWTMDDFMTAAKALTTEGSYGFGATPGLFPQWVAASGASYLTEEGKVEFTRPEVVKAAESFGALVSVDKVAPAVPATADPGDFVSGRFDSGNVAMLVDGPWSILGKVGTVKFDLGIVPMPAGPAGSQSVTAGSGFGISTSSKNKDAAWLAIQVLTGPEAEEYLGAAGRALPSRTAQQPFWYDVAAKDVAGAREALEYAMAHSKPYPIGLNWNTVENLMDQYIPVLFTGSQDAAKTMETIQNLATAQ